MKGHFLTAALALGAASLAEAAIISVDFAEPHADQVLLGGENIGPLGTDSANWNRTTESAGTLPGLKDETGTVTTASLTWSSADRWGTGEAKTNDNTRMSFGYLDDGGSGISITVTGIPYSNYVVLGLVSSDQGGGATYTTHDFTVNGAVVLGGTAVAHRTATASLAAEDAYWTPLTTSDVGNYWVSGTQTSSTLTITAPSRSGDTRGSITGLIIQQVPEPSSVLLLGASGALLGLIRRRRS